MSFNLKHIAAAWAKRFGLMETTPEEIELSTKRLAVCAVCDEARESAALAVIKGTIERVEIIYCSKCSCPCHEKSTIANEKCPLNKW